MLRSAPPRALRSWPRAAVSIAAFAIGVAASPAPARAYCRTTTEPAPAGFAGPDCWSGGKPLFWKNACISYDLQENASKQVSLSVATQDFVTAFGTWTSAACVDGGSPSIAPKDLGPVACGDVHYNQNAPNQHVIVFRDADWPHNDLNNTLGLTTMTFDINTGEIFDADMEINTHDQTLSTADAIPEAGYDFMSIITHEAGHFLGMAHSLDHSAVMFARYEPGSSLRALRADDVAGICSIYRANGDRVAADATLVPADACDPTPRHGFTSQCVADGTPTTSKGCACGVVGDVDPDASGGILAIGGGAIVVAAARRRRRA